MTVRSRTKQVLAMLLPAGVLGISAVLATMQAEASPTHLKADERISSVAERLSEIRAGVSAVEFKEGKNSVADAALLGEWPNFGGGFGWRNGGWGNGGWHNGGWGNGGWHNWHNGGWGNGGGWHNWHNFWHNW
jgi:rSAM-associated Gly-rich repeat protein